MLFSHLLQIIRGLSSSSLVHVDYCHFRSFDCAESALANWLPLHQFRGYHMNLVVDLILLVGVCSSRDWYLQEIHELNYLGWWKLLVN